jgi:hypothetical protein
MPSPTIKTQPFSLNSHGDKPEWWPRDDTWKTFVASHEYQAQGDLIIGEAEYAFSLKIVDYPHVVAMVSTDLDAFCDLIDRVDSWLKDRNIDCIAFDTNAVGKYKELSNAVLFRNADDAMLFKLTWL